VLAVLPHQAKEGAVAGRWVARNKTGLLILVAVGSLVSCGGQPAVSLEPTPTPGAHFLMPTPMAPVSEPPHTAAPEMLKYIVQEGDTLYDIALRYEVSIEELVRINRMKDPNSLSVGQELLIPLAPRETATPVP
jgi:hypothetical protein